MDFSRFFIDRPIFAAVLSILIRNIFHAVAELPVGLRHHAPGTPELVEIIDVRRAQKGLQRPEEIGQRHALRFRLIAVNLDVQLRHVSLVG
jgi:hypothetical protein